VELLTIHEDPDKAKNGKPKLRKKQLRHMGEDGSGNLHSPYFFV